MNHESTKNSRDAWLQDPLKDL
ncbi:hypothetical protein Tco_0899452, partial [Tanacetum coccineum]